MISLLELTRIVSGNAMHTNRWRWLFEESPGGKGIFSLGVHEERIVGQYVIVPQRMMINGKEGIGALSCETMTAPAYRRQGMFVTLAKKTYEKAIGHGISIIYGFPNASSYHGFVNHLGFGNFAVPFHVRLLKGGRLVRKKLFAGKLGEFIGSGGQWVYDRIFCGSRGEQRLLCSMSLKNNIDDSFDSLWERSKLIYPNMVIRDRSYLKWRYMSDANPHYFVLGAEDLHGTLRAYLVFRCFDRNGVRQGHVFDLMSDRAGENLVLALVSKALDIMRDEAAEIAVCMLPKKSPYCKAFRKLGFFLVPNKNLLFICRANSPQVCKDGISDWSKWHITLGDSDFV